jgi:hypothetical protein
LGKASEEETLKSAMCHTTDENAFRSDRNATGKMSWSIPSWCCSSVGQVVIGRVVRESGLCTRYQTGRVSISAGDV